jgi:hypothetical protein
MIFCESVSLEITIVLATINDSAHIVSLVHKGNEILFAYDGFSIIID